MDVNVEKARKCLRFFGAQGGGKTTLANIWAQILGWIFVPEVARAELARREKTLRQLRSSVVEVNSYQRSVFLNQMPAELEALERGSGIVTDRAIDAIAYCAEHSTITREIYESDAFKDYVEFMRYGFNFFIRPYRGMADLDDGTRAVTGWDGRVRIDGMILFILEAYGIPYIQISTGNLKERMRLVEFVLKSSGRVNFDSLTL